MSTTQDILTFIVGSLGSLFLLFVILRFFLQLARADFYNPFSQAIVKITNPLLIPLRRIIPGIFGVDLAAVVLALLVQLFISELLCLILFQSWYSPLQLLLWGTLGILNIVCYIVFACIIVMVISSFVAPHSRHPLLLLVHQLMAPIVDPVRKIIPALGGLDFSVMFIGMGMVILQKLVYATAVSVRLIPNLVVGF
ncbi:YggT family protein [Agaribacterium haliotis]|uniref:YggT family protein n=1 Tax=Agaribacterium haliotis TaxID=2013869 RepID=UPI000BB52B7C|nr:YggT family protein [Agaribacterium haliotis]